MSLIEELKDLYPELSVEDLQQFKENLLPVNELKSTHKRNKKSFDERKCDSNSKYLSTVNVSSSSDNSSENDFEQFVEKMKTPVVKKSENFSAQKMAEFIVKDDSGSESESSPTFYLKSLNERISKRINKPINKRLVAGDSSTKAADAAVSGTNRIQSSSTLTKSYHDENSHDSLITFVPKSTPKNIVLKGRMKTFSTPVTDKAIIDPTPVEARTFLNSLSCDNKSVSFVCQFRKNRQLLIEKLYKIFNEYIFADKLPSNLSITWNVRMTKTAGFCIYKKDHLHQRVARIELSDKVCDSAERVRDTLIHEMCHAAVWLLHGVQGNHGKIWKHWAKVAKHKFPDLPNISRCHSYEINAKYIYRCTSCSYEIRRHSKSLDVEKNVCGYCKGKFQLVRNNFKTTRTDSTPSQTPKFALFVQANYSSSKKSQQNLSHKDIMRLLGDQFKQQLRFVDDS